MKERFERMHSFFEAKMAQDRKGWDFFLSESYANFLRAFEDESHVVWVSCYAFPMELIWAFDVIPFDFEVAANMLPEAIGGLGSSIMAEAENRGYARDICSFFRLVLGCHFNGMLPGCDLHLSSSYYCNGKMKTAEILANAQGKECVLLDVPNRIDASAIQYVKKQLVQIAEKLERLTDKPLDEDRLRQSIRHSNQARKSCLELNECMKEKPCPWDGYRACLLGISGNLFFGNPVRDEINRMLIAEIENRWDRNAFHEEKRRVLWYPWVPVQQTKVFATLRRRHVNIASVEAMEVFWPELDENDPFESLAIKTLSSPHVGGLEGRKNRLLQMARDYKVDGVIHFSTPACIHETGSTSLLRDAFRESELPFLDLEGDMTDERNQDEGKMDNTLASFLEAIEG